MTVKSSANSVILILFAISNSKLSADSWNRGNHLLGCMLTRQIPLLSVLNQELVVLQCTLFPKLFLCQRPIYFTCDWFIFTTYMLCHQLVFVLFTILTWANTFTSVFSLGFYYIHSFEYFSVSIFSKEKFHKFSNNCRRWPANSKSIFILLSFITRETLVRHEGLLWAFEKWVGLGGCARLCTIGRILLFPPILTDITTISKCAILRLNRYQKVTKLWGGGSIPFHSFWGDTPIQLFLNLQCWEFSVCIFFPMPFTAPINKLIHDRHMESILW